MVKALPCSVRAFKTRFCLLYLFREIGHSDTHFLLVGRMETRLLHAAGEAHALLSARGHPHAAGAAAALAAASGMEMC